MLPIPIPPEYNFKDPVFSQIRKYKGFAENHKRIFEIWRKSDVISYEIVETETHLNIPVVYKVHYVLNSIIGIDGNKNPVYGNHHILELSIKGGYPVKPPTAYMQTSLWHPNIKWDGPHKGRVCVNSKGLGVAFTLDLTILRIAEIIQYQNYLAEFIPPYPEDEVVAKWVREVAEPAGIVDRSKGIVTDNSPLLRTDGSIKDLSVPSKGKIVIVKKNNRPSINTEPIKKRIIVRKQKDN